MNKSEFDQNLGELLKQYPEFEERAKLLLFEAFTSLLYAKYSVEKAEDFIQDHIKTIWHEKIV